MTTVESKEQVELTTEEWLAIRKEAGLRIDAATAEITWCWGLVMDPYGVGDKLAEECDQIGRVRFARSPGGGVWVSFDDLPEATVAALWKRIDAGDHDDWKPFRCRINPYRAFKHLIALRLDTKPK